ncbi:MAG: GCN5-related N-acetyltransferase [Promethearchaeota archaeon CR_4]|nr:MAG: GCN5-related N-acetyltransferase [Candidatus Lokiarchaeota archaeon CR_4]
MSMTPPPLCIPGRNQVKDVSRVWAESFADYPLYTYTLPDPGNRVELLQVIFEVVATYAMRYAKLFATSERLEGVMGYLPADAIHVSSLRMLKSGAFKIPLKVGRMFLKRLMSVTKHFEHLRAKHANFPHIYLWNVGVQPSLKGQGYGSRLIRSLLYDLMPRNKPCYLETVLESNVRIYEHLGFQVMEKCEIPEAHMTTWAMLWQNL